MSDPLPGLAAAVEDRYTIERELGEGGMARVYLAEDRKHQRKVALKVLKPELAAVVGGSRFLAEIRTTAALQHPHILPLYDSGEVDGLLFYVMPYVEGESLRDRLDREGQLPVDEAVEIAQDLAEALGYAHRHGVIHRDLKPANVLLHEGRPLISDFGVALAVGATAGKRLTETGLSVGTSYYMSPEQAAGGQEVGPRSDLYSLGCVLFEMLAGEPPYTGSTPQAVLSRILQSEPVLVREARSSVPLHVDAAIRKALEKVPADRFKDADEFQTALKDTSFRHGSAGSLSGGHGWKVATGVLSLVAVSLLGWVWLRPSPGGVGSLETLRLALAFEDGQELLDQPSAGRGSLAIARDGSFLTYTGPSSGGDYQLWVRRRDELAPEPLQGTRLAGSPAVSPDGSEIAFILREQLHTIPSRGGTVRTLGAESASFGTEWGRDGFIYYTDARGGISRIPPVDGPEEAVLAPPSGEVLRDPHLLAGERAILVTRADPTGRILEIMVGDLRSGELLGTGIRGSGPRFLPTGHLAFVSESGLTAVEFDLDAMTALGRERLLAEEVAEFVVSETGSLVHRSDLRRSSMPVWVTRSGDVERLDSEWNVPNPEDRESVSLSQDGAWVALSVTPPGGTTHLWIRPTDASGAATRLTVDGVRNYRADWSPDGTHVAFISVLGEREQIRLVRVASADARSSPEVLVELELPVDEVEFSGDGEWVIVRTGIGQDDRDIWAVRADGSGDPVPVVTTPGANDRAPALSPDGRWMAFVSDESGENQIWVAPFPNPEGLRRQISTGGGQEPRWSPSGEELFYRNAANEMIAVRVEIGESFRQGRQTVLFPASDFLDDPNHAVYDVGPSGDRFLMLERQDLAGSVVWVENWFAELSRSANRP